MVALAVDLERELRIEFFFAQNAELYYDIITASSDSVALIERYHARFGEALDLLRRGDRAAFVERFAEIGDWFGPYAERFLAESRTLLAHADANECKAWIIRAIRALPTQTDIMEATNGDA